MKSLALLSSVALGVIACSAADSDNDAAPGSNAPAPSVETGQIPIAVEPARTIGGGASQLYAAPWPGLFPDDDGPAGQSTLPRSFPAAIRESGARPRMLRQPPRSATAICPATWAGC